MSLGNPALRGFMVEWVILKFTALKMLFTVSLIWFPKTLASFPNYGSLKYTEHLFGPKNKLEKP